VAGRPGIAVTACVPVGINKGPMLGFHGCPKRDELIFDARTYELIGQYQKTAKGTPPAGGSAGQGAGAPATGPALERLAY
jgi:hypothetical protein